MHEGCPALRRHSHLPQPSHRVIESARDGVCADRFAFEQSSVEELSDRRSVVVVHGPASQFAISHYALNCPVGCLPHGPDDALEPDEQHGGRQMDGLVGLLSISLGRLACAEKRQICMLEVEFHEVGYGERPIAAKVERALKRVDSILGAVTRNMDDARRLESGGHLLVRGPTLREHRVVSANAQCEPGHEVDLRAYLWQGSEPSTRDVRGRHEHKPRVTDRSWRPLSLCAKQRGQCRSIRRDHIV
jgi:hypothetical protein